MTEYHFPIPGSVKDKDIVVFARRHWAAFLGQFLLCFILLVLPIIILIIIYAFGFETKIFQGLVLNFLVLVFSIYYLIAITFSFIAWISFYYDIYIVTKGEIIEITQEGFFGRKISQLSLLRVQDVTSTVKGILQTIFSFGDVLVETASEAQENFLLKSIANPQEISAKIMAIHDEVIKREKRGSQILEAEGDLTDKKSNYQTEAKNFDLHISQELKGEVHSQKNPQPENFAKEKTPYQQLLEKEQSQPSNTHMSEGEVTKDDLDKGGEVDF